MKKTSPSALNIILFVFSLANTGVGLPVALVYGFLGMLFGSLSDDRVSYYARLIIIGFYILFSIIALLITTWNVFKYNKVLKTIYKIGVIILITLIVIFICYIAYYLK